MTLPAAAPTTAGPDGGGPTTAPAPTTAVEPTSAGEAPPDATVLVDGRHPALLLAVDAGRRTARFDVIQFLTGDAANRAAGEDGQPTPVPNDYYTRNTSDRLRTLEVVAGAPITVNALAAGEAATPADVRVTLDELATRMVAGSGPIFWLTIRANRIVRMEQQYLP